MRLPRLALALCAVALVAVACGGPQVLSDEPFRDFVPANAQLSDESVDDGSSLMFDGERSVLRVLIPVPPADAEAVLAALLEQGESQGWDFRDTSPTLAIGTKDISGRPWMVSLAVDGSTVVQLFAGR